MEAIFEKLGRYFCDRWHLAVLDMDRGRWLVAPKASHIAYLKAENANGRHILIQPDSTMAPHYLLIDDLAWYMVQRQHKRIDGTWKPGRMVVETSMGNYQVWIHSSRPLSLEEKRYWLKKLNSDPGADPNNRWGRCPGFRNRKSKHRQAEGGYPLSKLIWIDWKCRVEVPDIFIHSAGTGTKSLPIQGPEGGARRDKNITRSNYARGDESATDFAYAMALFRKGVNARTVRERILFERKEWNHHLGEKRMQDYLDRTIRRAKMLVDRC